MAMAAPTLNSSFGGGQNVMLMRGDLGSSNSLVAMLNGFQVPRSGGGLEDIACGQKRPLPYSSSFPQQAAAFEGGMEEGAELEEALDGEAPGQVEKKRRLSFDQVRSLEKNFELENKLEPERKMQLAKELGLQPRQVAVWFQNRRARWKTKQLERDYEMLNTGYLKLKADFEAALREKEVLKAKVQRLSGKTSTSHDSQSDVESSQCDSEAATPDSQTQKNSSPATECKDSSKAAVVTSSDGSNEESSSELLDADSPRTTDHSNRAGSLGDADNLVVSYCDHFPAPESFVASGELGFPVKLEDAQSFDTSCNYFLPPMVDSQSVLPWWDWA